MEAPITTPFLADGMDLTRLLVSDVERSKRWHRDVLGAEVEHDWEIRAFFRDPDGHLFEISEHRRPASAS